MIILFLLNATNILSEKIHLKPKEKMLRVSIIQDGMEHPIASNWVMIKKRPFYFKFIFQKEASVKINFYDQPQIMNAAKRGIHPAYLHAFLVGTSFAGYSDNRCKYFIISNEGSHFWGYSEGGKFNRFTRIIEGIENKEYWKEIRTFYDPKIDKEIPIEMLPQNRLFITIVYPKPFENIEDMPRKHVSFAKALEEAPDEESRKYFQWLIDSMDEKGYDYSNFENDVLYYEEYTREYFILDFK